MVTFAALVRMTVPVTDRKRPTSLDLGITSLVISGHSGKPVHIERIHQHTVEEQDLIVKHGAELFTAKTNLNSTIQVYSYCGIHYQDCL